MRRSDVRPLAIRSVGGSPLPGHQIRNYSSSMGILVRAESSALTQRSLSTHSYEDGQDGTSALPP